MKEPTLFSSTELLEGGKINQIFFDKQPIKSRKARNINEAETQLFLLKKFLQINSETSAMNYVKHYGFPDLSYVKVIPSLKATAEEEKQTQHIGQAMDLIYHSKAILCLTMIIDAINRKDFGLIDTLVQSEEYTGRQSLFDSSWPDVKIRLFIGPDSSSELYELWNLSEQFLKKPDLTKVVSRNEWRINKKNQKFLFLQSYVAELISTNLSHVRFKIDPTGEVGLHAELPIDGIFLCLLAQFRGATAVKICWNKNCPNKFFFLTGSAKRKARSDRKFCSRPGCQKWCHTNGEGPRKKDK